MTGGTDLFVTRFSPAGAVQFSSRFGGVDDEGARGLSIAGNVVTVTGTAFGAAFPLVNAPGITCQPSDAFAASFNVASSTVLFSSCFGGSLKDEARGHVTDVVGTTYLFGFTASKDFPVVNGVQSQADAFTSDGMLLGLRIGDSDGDGVVDGRDNCAYQANTTQTDGDHDGIGDVCDPNPTDPGSTNVPPVARITANPAVVGQPVVFDPSTSSDTGGRIVRYEWDLDDDGSFDDAASVIPQTVTATYMVNGDRAVSLKVTDDLGAWHSVRYLFSVRGPGQAILSSTHTEAVFGTIVRLQVDVPPAAGGSAPTGNGRVPRRDHSARDAGAAKRQSVDGLSADVAAAAGHPRPPRDLSRRSQLPVGAEQSPDPDRHAQTAGGLQGMGPRRRIGNRGGLRAARAACGQQHRVRCPRRRERPVGTVRHTRRSQPLGMGGNRPARSATARQSLGIIRFRS